MKIFQVVWTLHLFKRFAIQSFILNLVELLHLCLKYFQSLLKLTQENIRQHKSFTLFPQQKTYEELNGYLTLLSSLSNDNQITCAPILHWFECDNRGRNLKVPHALGDVADINIPAIAAASVVRRYVAKEDDELDLEVGCFVLY